MNERRDCESVVYRTTESNVGTAGERGRDEETRGIKERITAERGANVRKRKSARSRNEKLKMRRRGRKWQRVTYQRTEGERGVEERNRGAEHKVPRKK